MRGRWEMSYALYPHAGDWDDGGVAEAAERYRHDLLASPGSGDTQGGWPPGGAGEATLALEGRGVSLSSLRRRPEGWLEVRLVNLAGGAAQAELRGEILEARDASLRGVAGDPLEVDPGGILRLHLGPAEIRTVQLRRDEATLGRAEVLEVAGPRQGA
jgi:hypothetical protein